MNRPGAKHYQQMNVQTSLSDASPHQLIALLFDGLLSRLAIAKGCMDRGDYEGKSNALGAAFSILAGLQDALDKERGGDVADNMDSLYDYMTRRVFAAGVANDPQIIDEVCGLVRTVKSGWMAIKEEVA